MAQSTYRQDEYLTNAESALGHSYKESLVKYPIMMIGASGMYSCADDMTRFIRCVLNQGVYNGQRIIKQKILEQMYNEYPPSNEWLYNFGLVTGLIKGRTMLHSNGNGFGFKATQNILIDSGLGVVALLNSNECPDIQLTIIMNMWDDLLDLQDAGKDDCENIPDDYEPLIGIYEAKSNIGSWKLKVIPRNGAIYCNEHKLEHHSGNLFFNANNDSIEFIENGMIYDNVTCRRIL